MVPTITSPATQALELQQHNTTVLIEARRGSSITIDSKLSYEFFNLNFEEDNVNAFPVIEWDHSNEDSDSLSDSSSVRSMDSWNSVLTDFDSDSSLGKRGRCNSNKLSSSSSRRLVRSKKIKSDLASLARGRDFS